jgi:hypothetical protein
LETPLRLVAQPAIQQRLYELLSGDPSFDVDSLVTSILHNGFLKHERLIVCPFDGDKFLVLEGNRRLTAVRKLLTENPTPDALPDYVASTLQTLPCLVLEGPPISGNEKALGEYRRRAEIFVGMRHLMGARSWDPASRYEFQHRLIFNEGWTPAEVAERFGRNKSEVQRDLKAQVLYNDFRDFEQRVGLDHSLTYNAFAEAARAPAIMNWLGWSNKKLGFENREREEAFFQYLISRMKTRAKVSHVPGEEETPSDSAEQVVRRLRDMLKTGDETTSLLLADREFDDADMLFERRKDGSFSKRVSSFARSLGRVGLDEITSNAGESTAALLELKNAAEKLLKVVQKLD